MTGGLWRIDAIADRSMNQYQQQPGRSNLYSTVKTESSPTPPLATGMANSTAVPGKGLGTPGPAGRVSPEGSQVRLSSPQKATMAVLKCCSSSCSWHSYCFHCLNVIAGAHKGSCCLFHRVYPHNRLKHFTTHWGLNDEGVVSSPLFSSLMSTRL